MQNQITNAIDKLQKVADEPEDQLPPPMDEAAALAPDGSRPDQYPPSTIPPAPPTPAPTLTNDPSSGNTDGNPNQPPATPVNPADQPKVPFQTDLKLTGDQEKRMIEHAFKRLGQLMDESGRSQTLQPTWWLNSPAVINIQLASQGLQPAGDTWMGKRSRYEATLMNDVSWRPYTMGPDTIFSSSNFTVPLSRRICRQMQAKAKNAFFGTDPWFSCEPAPQPSQEADNELADQVEKFCRFKLRQSNSKDDKCDAIDRALGLGECAVKTTYVVRDQLFDVEATVLTDVEGLPVRDTQGNTISPDDQFVDAEDGLGTQVLARDKQTPMPDAPIWQKHPLNRRQVLFEGARSEPIYYKDFLCPITARTVQEADCIVHLYDKSVMEFVDLVVKRGMVDGNTAGRADAARKMISLVKSLSDNTSAPKSASTQELRPGENFSAAPIGGDGPVSEMAEFYMWYDANDDGIAENIMLIIDKKTQAPIYYDHVANVTTDGLRPIEIIRINPIKGRWYGMGVVELFETYQTIVDLLVNRWNFSQSRAGRVDFWNPNNTQEGDANPNLKMNYGQSYTLKPGMKAEDTLKSIYLTDTKFDQLKAQMDLFMQLAMNESGVMNANDGQSAGLAQSNLATGIIDIQKSGDELFKPIVADLTGPLQRLLEREIDVTLANMNPEETYSYLEGDNTEIATLTPDDVRGLKFKVNIELTSHKNQEIVQLSGQATALVKDFYSQPPIVQQKTAGLYRRQLRALCPSVDADDIIQVVMPDGVPAPMEGAAAAPAPGGGGAHAASPTQLIQKHAQPTGQTAKGGTPAK